MYRGSPSRHPRVADHFDRGRVRCTDSRKRKGCSSSRNRRRYTVFLSGLMNRQPFFSPLLAAAKIYRICTKISNRFFESVSKRCSRASNTCDGRAPHSLDIRYVLCYLSNYSYLSIIVIVVSSVLYDVPIVTSNTRTSFALKSQSGARRSRGNTG